MLQKFKSDQFYIIILIQMIEVNIKEFIKTLEILRCIGNEEKNATIDGWIKELKEELNKRK